MSFGRKDGKNKKFTSAHTLCMKDVENEEINVSSATECTGLIPSLPEDDEEEDHYRDILKISPAKQ